MKSELLLYAACIVLIVVPLWFIAHKVYDDGIVGRILLCLIVWGAFAILGQAGVTYAAAWIAGLTM